MEKAEGSDELGRLFMEMRAQAIGRALTFPAKRERVLIRIP